MSSTTQLLRRLILLVLALVFVPFFMMLVMTPMLGAPGGHMWNGSVAGGPVSPWLWALLWLIVAVAIVAIGYFLYGSVREPDDQQRDQAIEELRVAYARGELSDEEFETRLERLRRDE